MKTKNRILICTAAAFLILGAVGITAAYLGARDNKTNKLNIDKGDEVISEVWSEPNFQTIANETDKHVSVTNKGSTPCFVRVYVDFSDSGIAEKAQLSEDGTSYKSWSEFKASHSSGTDWIYIPYDEQGKLGGYFYYTKSVSGSASTPPLIQKVKTDFSHNETKYNEAETTDGDFITDFDLIVYSETVQTVDNGIDYSTQTDGWKTMWKIFLKDDQPITP